MAPKSDFFDYEPVHSTKPSSVTGAREASDEGLNRSKSELHNTDSAIDELAVMPPFHSDEEGTAVKAKETKQKESLKKENLARGHGITYFSLFLFTAVLFFRPYELFSLLSGLTSLAFWLGVLTVGIFVPMQLALEGSLTARPREVILVLLLSLLALLSIPLALSPGEAWLTFNDTFVRAILIFIVIVNVVRTERRLYGLIFLSVGVSCLLSVGAIDDFRAGHFAQQGRRILGLVGGMFGNPNDLALHLATMFPLAIAALLSFRNLLVKVACGIGAVLFVGAIVATFSRAGFLALAGAGLVLTWKLGKRQRFITMSMATIVIAAFIALAPGGYADRILSIFGLRPDPVGSAGARQNLLTQSLYTSLRHPLGIGMGNYHIVAAREAVSHNAYTQVAAELGLLALVVYIMFIVAPLKRLRRIEREALSYWETSQSRAARRCYYLAIGLQASLVAYMIGSFFASVAYQWYIYYLVGYSICLHRIYAANVGLPESTGKKNKTKLTAPGTDLGGGVPGAEGHRSRVIPA